MRDMLHCTHACVERTPALAATLPTKIKFGRGRRMAGRNTNDEDSTPLDPVALSLAIWLGLLTCVAGLSRLTIPPPGPGTSNAQGGTLDRDAAYRAALAFGT